MFNTLERIGWKYFRCFDKKFYSVEEQDENFLEVSII
jgi:hypothetical protein